MHFGEGSKQFNDSCVLLHAFRITYNITGQVKCGSAGHNIHVHVLSHLRHNYTYCQ